MLKRQLIGITTVLLAVYFCLSFAQPSYSATVVSLDSNAGPLADIAALQFDILSPTDVSVSDFSSNLPAAWFNFSTDKVVNAFDASGTASLPIGVIGSFDVDVTLGNWVIGNQDANTLIEGTDYQILHNGSNYAIDAVPIPGAIWLLGSGLIGIVAIRRKKVKV